VIDDVAFSPVGIPGLSHEFTLGGLAPLYPAMRAPLRVGVGASVNAPGVRMRG
jgi:hypothetical protein